MAGRIQMHLDQSTPEEPTYRRLAVAVLLARGWTVPKIVVELKCSKQFVYLLRQELLTKGEQKYLFAQIGRPPKVTVVDLSKLLARMERRGIVNPSIDTLASALDCSRATIKRLRARLRAVTV